jgi:hypothetical protein
MYGGSFWTFWVQDSSTPPLKFMLDPLFRITSIGPGGGGLSRMQFAPHPHRPNSAGNVRASWSRPHVIASPCQYQGQPVTAGNQYGSNGRARWHCNGPAQMSIKSRNRDSDWPDLRAPRWGAEKVPFCLKHRKQCEKETLQFSELSLL